MGGGGGGQILRPKKWGGWGGRSLDLRNGGGGGGGGGWQILDSSPPPLLLIRWVIGTLNSGLGSDELNVILYEVGSFLGIDLKEIYLTGLEQNYSKVTFLELYLQFAL